MAVRKRAAWLTSAPASRFPVMERRRWWVRAMTAKARETAWGVVRSAGAWEQQGPKLSSPAYGGTSAQFGFSVALSGDGSAALIGAPQTDSYVGRTWLLQRTAGNWAAQAQPLELFEEDGKGSAGASVALSADGATALVGGPTDGSRAGAVWALERGAASPPTVSALAPSSGPQRGGTTVTITGTHLGLATEVDFGAVSARYRVISPTSITATSPPEGGAGTVDVTVRSTVGVSASSSADRFTYASQRGQTPPGTEAPEVAESAEATNGVLGFGASAGSPPGRCTVRLLGSPVDSRRAQPRDGSPPEDRYGIVRRPADADGGGRAQPQAPAFAGARRGHLRVRHRRHHHRARRP